MRFNRNVCWWANGKLSVFGPLKLAVTPVGKLTVADKTPEKLFIALNVMLTEPPFPRPVKMILLGGLDWITKSGRRPNMFGSITRLEIIEKVTRIATSSNHSGTGLFNPRVRFELICPSFLRNECVPIQVSGKLRQVSAIESLTKHLPEKSDSITTTRRQFIKSRRTWNSAEQPQY
jgi:hypothetical protein